MTFFVTSLCDDYTMMRDEINGDCARCGYSKLEHESGVVHERPQTPNINEPRNLYTRLLEDDDFNGIDV